MDSSQSHHQNPNNNWLAFSLSNHHDADPKLEDFLGGGDSELKTVAASLFSGFSTSNWRWLLRRRSKITLRRRNRLITSANELPFTVALQGIDGQGDMKLIYGIIVAEEKGKVGKEDKITIYLGGYDKEDKAARAYDLAALKYWSPTTTTNFPVCNYEKELEEMKNMTRQEFVASLRRKSSGFSRGASIYRGVTRHHQHGRWHARIGRVAGNKDLYLGTFGTQEAAAEAYDIAAIKFRGTLNSGYYNGGEFIQQENNNGTVALSTAMTIPMGTPIGLNGSSYGNRIEQSFHSYQPAKQNLSLIQTPIFGIE
ncbi:hypothetical protein L1987_54445 [Smallanthus sonchifolius]|uniref:Uncharacterized protein n=1 Tax=Smallanthus sonchifolius TaxID=185202 RepID=A0ACB9E6M6_9ASTR|nr:hypothetical protein L1987_54445 [Smallanthus sonchifolius]